MSKSLMFLLSLTLFGVLFAAILPALSQAQYLEPPGLEPLEEQLRQAEEAEQQRLEAERVAQERAEENAQRWRDFTRFRDEVRDDTRDLMRRGEPARLLHQLEERNRFWRIGMIWYHLGDDRAAGTYAGRSFTQEEHEWAVREGHTQTLFLRTQLLNEFDGEGWSDRTARTVNRIIEGARASLERSLNEELQRRREQRGQTYAQFNEWLDGFVAAAEASAEKLQTIEADTWNAQAIWDLTGIYRDGLVNYMRAHEWLSVLKRYFPEANLVRSGRVDARIAEGLVRMGLLDEAEGYLQGAETTLNQELDTLEQAQAALRQRMQEEGIERQALSEEERRILNANVGELRNALTRTIRESRERVEQYAGYILRDAGRE